VWSGTGHAMQGEADVVQTVLTHRAPASHHAFERGHVDGQFDVSCPLQQLRCLARHLADEVGGVVCSRVARPQDAGQMLKQGVRQARGCCCVSTRTTVWRTWTLTEGDAVVIPPQRPHHVEPGNDVELSVTFFTT
jgi:hypothetical protein